VNFWGAPFDPTQEFDDTSRFYLSQLKKRYVAIFDIASVLSQMAETDISKGASPPGYATGEVNVDAKR